MPKRRRQTEEILLIQDSPLLRLPAELRNKIYEECAVNESLSIRGDTLLYCPAFSLVCRQTRHEYQKVYLEETPKYAERIYVHITNFVSTQASKSLSILPPPQPWLERQYTIRVFLNNSWSRHDLRKFLNGWNLNEPWSENRGRPQLGPEIRVPYQLEVHFDSRVFDVHLFRLILPKLAFCHAPRSPTDSGRHNLDWEQVNQALRVALERHDQRFKSRPKKRTRKSLPTDRRKGKTTRSS